MSRRQKISAALVIFLNEEKGKKRKCWERDWIAKRRQNAGVYRELLKELEEGDAAAYEIFFRMSISNFNALLEMVAPIIQKRDSHLRPSIPAAERLAVTLRFLATGDSYHSLMYLFRIPVCTIGRIVPEVCCAIYQVLKNKYLKIPNTEEEWMKYVDEFNNKWNFPNCFGALDGKHVVMCAPPNSGSMYFNYKGTHSVVLMALADANYKIIYMDVGCKGRVSDGGVFNQCTLSDALERNTLNIPRERPLTENGPPVPLVIVADDAFALKPYIMKPYPLRNLSGPERVYNYRLSRARRVVENLFGIMSARFRVLLKPIHLDERKTTKIVLAICALHNFLMTETDTRYSTPIDFDRETDNGEIIPGRWRNELNTDMQMLNTEYNRNPLKDGKLIQAIFRDYFVSSAGEVPWQYERI